MAGDVARAGRRSRAAAPGVVTGSVARLAADVVATAFMTATGAITARSLGPSSKGTLVALLFLVVFAAHVAAVGLGDAVVVHVGRGEDAEACAGTSSAIALASVPLAAVLLAALSAVGAGGPWSEVRSALPAAVIAMAGWVVIVVGTGIAVARRWLVLAAVPQAVTWAVTFAVTFVLAVRAPLSVRSAAVAMASGTLAGAVTIGWGLARQGVSPRPRWDRTRVRALLRTGIPIQVSYLLTVLSLRLDVLVVLWLVNSAAAGFYSVALTVAQLASFPTLALATATFPSVTTLQGHEGDAYVGLVHRVGLLSSLALAVPGALLLPLVLPLVFGAGYRPAVAPALLLLAGASTSSLHWLSNRALAARGDRRGLLLSHGATLVAMLALDLVLIPAWGTTGAATASVTGAAVGATIAFHRALPGRSMLRELVPRRSDVGVVVSAVRTSLGRGA